MRKITSTNSRNNLGIIALSLMLGFISISAASAGNSTNYEKNKIQTSESQKTTQIKNSAKVTENKGKQEKVNVILNGDTVVSYAAVGNDTTDLSEESRNDSVGATNVNINGKNVDKDAINKIYSISNSLENILSTLGNSTFGSIIGVVIGLLIATLAICFVIFILGFPIWIVLFLIWLYRRIKRNREDQRRKDEASFMHKENLEPKQDSENNSNYDFSQDLNHSPNDYNYREAIMSANNMIESATRQIFMGIGVGLFLLFFVSDDMGIAIGALITLIGVGKRISGKQRLKNIKEYCTDRDNYYGQKSNKQEEKKEQEEEVEKNQQEPSSNDDTTPKGNDNCQQL